MQIWSGAQRRILIPVSFRGEYLTGLRTLSRQGHPDAYLKVLDYAQECAWRIDFSDYEQALSTLTVTEAFDEAEGQSTLAVPDGDGRPEPKLRLPAARRDHRISIKPARSAADVTAGILARQHTVIGCRVRHDACGEVEALEQ